MAGSIPLSLTQRLDNATLEPLDGGTITFYAAGTTTPQSAFQDVSLTIPWPNPLTLDAGNVPQLFFADGYIKFRISNSAGVTQLAADNVLVIGPSAGAGAAPSVDASTVFGTGDVKARYGTGAHSGWVRANGRTIGSSTSGASERANADCQDLFEYLWGADSNLSVSGGRGGSANADWVANKTIALPDVKGRVIAGLDDMGDTAASRLTSAWMTPNGTTLGATGGTQDVALVAANNGPHAHTGTTDIDGAHRHTISSATALVQSGASFSVVTSFGGAGVTGFTNLGVNDGSHDHDFTTDSQGSGTAHLNVQPTIAMTIYMKL